MFFFYIFSLYLNSEYFIYFVQFSDSCNNREGLRWRVQSFLSYILTYLFEDSWYTECQDVNFGLDIFIILINCYSSGIIQWHRESSLLRSTTREVFSFLLGYAFICLSWNVFIFSSIFACIPLTANTSGNTTQNFLPQPKLCHISLDF